MAFLDDAGVTKLTSYLQTKIENLITSELSSKQDTLVSGTNIKTVNNESILGSGDVSGTLIDLFYPVGSYYETSNTNFNPNTAWGGTWVKDSAGRVTVALDTSQSEFSDVGDTGGSKYIQAHTHVVATQPNFKIPNHSHTLHRTQIGTASGSSNRYYASGSDEGGSTATDGGGGTCTRSTDVAIGAVSGLPSGQNTGNAGNLQPYVVVNRWHRTA